MITKPFIKWVGGKTQIINEVINLFPNEINNYYEPFLGGGSVLLALLSFQKAGKIKINGKIFASDLNTNLIFLFQNIQSYPQEIINEVKILLSEYNMCQNTDVNRSPSNITEALTSHESYYYWIRYRFNSVLQIDRNSIKSSAMLLFLNKTCFRGLYREGPHGFNVPFGNYKKIQIIEEDIFNISELIKDVVFRICNFEDALVNLESGDFVYLDPPYAQETNKSFVSYTKDNFNLDANKKLFEICDSFKNKNVKMLLSNADVTLIRNSFPSPLNNTTVISCRRAINSKKPDSRANEVLITITN
jgi:DNA adenine methylase